MQIRVSAAQLELGRGDYRMAVENARNLSEKRVSREQESFVFPNTGCSNTENMDNEP